MKLSDLKVGQTMQRTDLTRPFVGRIVGVDLVGPCNGKPRVLLVSDAGDGEMVTERELADWIVLGAK